MKKIIIASLILAFFAGTVSAQTKNKKSTVLRRMDAQENAAARGGDNIWNGPVILSTSFKEGQNAMVIKEGKGILQFTKTGDKFTNVTYKDSMGVVTRLTPVAAGTQGAPKPGCKDPLPDACFAAADKNIGLCICKPGTISGDGNEMYTVRLQMPVGKPGAGTPGH